MEFGVGGLYSKVLIGGAAPNGIVEGLERDRVQPETGAGSCMGWRWKLSVDQGKRKRFLMRVESDYGQ